MRSSGSAEFSLAKQLPHRRHRRRVCVCLCAIEITHEYDTHVTFNNDGNGSNIVISSFGKGASIFFFRFTQRAIVTGAHRRFKSNKCNNTRIKKIVRITSTTAKTDLENRRNTFNYAGCHAVCVLIGADNNARTRNRQKKKKKMQKCAHVANVRLIRCDRKWLESTHAFLQ